jgi:LemA protein
VRLTQHCRESWSDIETELKRRHDLIPNLVETVKGYAKHEQETLRLVVEARARAMAEHRSRADLARDENALAGTLKQLFALSESYPDLKANQNFLQLQRELTNTEDRIQAARRFYNANVRDLNTRVAVFPSNLIAGMFGFTRADFFEIEDGRERLAPAVNM